MFVKARYIADRRDVIDMLRNSPLAAIVSRDPHGFTANHFPLVFDPDKGQHGTLIGHMARSNPQHQALRNDPHVLAIFTGSSGYVSSSWYSAGRDMAPTWNYAAVHCHGQLTFSPNDAHTVWTLQRLLDHVEQHRPNAWQIPELGKAGLERRLPLIIGFEIALDRIEAKLQMSQYERPKDTAEAIDFLRKEGNTELAETMHRCNFARPDEKPSK